MQERRVIYETKETEFLSLQEVEIVHESLDSLLIRSLSWVHLDRDSSPVSRNDMAGAKYSQLSFLTLSLQRGEIPYN